MPTYDYYCAVCNTREEHFFKFTDVQDVTCNKCNNAMSKVISAVPVSLKGDGWAGRKAF